MKYYKSFLLIFLIFIFFFFSGCAWTNISTIKNPELSQVKYKKVLVIAAFSDITVRKQTENAFINQFKLSGYHAISSIELIPPIKNYTEEELLEILTQKNIDGILVIALQDYWTSKAYIPKSSTTQGNVSFYGNSLYFQSYTQEFGGFYISKPRIKFEIRFFDIKSAKVAWLATTFTRGNAFADYNVLITSIAKEVVKKLKEEHIILK